MALIIGTEFSDNIFGTAFNDEMQGLGGDDVFFASAGDDDMVGGFGIDTADYSNLGRAMAITPGGFVDKNGLGVDRLIGVERIIGAQGFDNWIDGQGGSGSASFNIDLSENRLTVNGLPGIGSFSFAAINFSNVRGTNNNDSIVGNSGNNILDGAEGDDTLTGGSGNDVLSGGAGVDILTGTDSFSAGAGEIDVLTGGGNANGFRLGDSFGSYYRSGGFSDYAIITDLNSNDVIQLGRGETYFALQDATGFDLYVIRSGGILDLVADVQSTSTAPVPTGVFQLASGQVFGNFLGA